MNRFSYKNPFIKSDPFKMGKGTSDGALSCAVMLKVLADETRLAVVRQLFTSPRHVGELQAALEIEQSLLSHHLRLLREAGIVESERDGKSVLYRLTSSVELRRRGDIIDLGCCQLSFPSNQ